MSNPFFEKPILKEVSGYMAGGLLRE